MKNTMFDASPYAAGLNPAYDPAQTHFTYLDDVEIVGGGLWMAQFGENLHVTIQNTNHTVVAHYFYNKGTNFWRYHGYGGAAAVPTPYGTHAHVNLLALRARAIEFAWPPGNVVFKIQGHAKVAKNDARARKKQADEAKKLAKQQDMDEFFSPKGATSKATISSTLKPVRFQAPPGGRVTEGYIDQLISAKDRDSLEYLYRSNDWPLDKWEQDAWNTFLDWLTG